ncbi:MAG: hypothetical protein LC687_01075, partial [Actinobacteria bacterium]|nr:hypothetical protein [Actinomycetota bacterium]
MAGYLPSGPIDSGLSWSPIIFNNRDPYAPVQFPTAMSMDQVDLGSGITEVIGNVVTLPQAVTNHIQTVGEEWYHRIHLIPSKKELGNLLTAQTVDIEVWNGFLVSRTLNDITEERTEGITLSQPALPPLTYGILESKDYQVNVSVIGPPTVDGIYSFNFDVYPVLFNVTGNRVVVWPFVPDSDFVEILEWKTDIIQTKSTEQRISLRPVPRQSFNYRYLLSDREFASVKVIMAEWAQRSFSVPMWPDAEYVGPLSAGLTTLPIDDSQTDIIAGGAALIYEGPNSFEAIEIQDVNVGSVTLKNPTIFSYTKAFIMPVISSKANDGFSVSRDKTSFITGSCDFTGTTTNDLGFSNETQYKSKDILLDPNAYVSSIGEKIYREVDVHDSGVGIYSFEEKRNAHEHDQR